MLRNGRKRFCTGNLIKHTKLLSQNSSEKNKSVHRHRAHALMVVLELCMQPPHAMRIMRTFECPVTNCARWHWHCIRVLQYRSPVIIHAPSTHMDPRGIAMSMMIDAIDGSGWISWSATGDGRAVAISMVAWRYSCNITVHHGLWEGGGRTFISSQWGETVYHDMMYQCIIFQRITFGISQKYAYYTHQSIIVPS